MAREVNLPIYGSQVQAGQRSLYQVARVLPAQTYDRSWPVRGTRRTLTHDPYLPLTAGRFEAVRSPSDTKVCLWTPETKSSARSRNRLSNGEVFDLLYPNTSSTV